MSMALHPPKVWERFVDGVCLILTILINIYTTALPSKKGKRKVIINKNGLTTENAIIKQLFKENWYQEKIISKIYKIITSNRSLSQSQQQTQVIDFKEEEIIISINLSQVEGTSEKLWRILRSHKVRPTFYTEKTLRELLCKLRNAIATEAKNKITYEIGCYESY